MMVMGFNPGEVDSFSHLRPLRIHCEVFFLTRRRSHTISWSCNTVNCNSDPDLACIVSSLQAFTLSVPMSHAWLAWSIMFRSVQERLSHPVTARPCVSSEWRCYQFPWSHIGRSWFGESNRTAKRHVIEVDSSNHHYYFNNLIPLVQSTLTVFLYVYCLNCRHKIIK